MTIESLHVLPANTGAPQRQVVRRAREAGRDAALLVQSLVFMAIAMMLDGS